MVEIVSSGAILRSRSARARKCFGSARIIEKMLYFGVTAATRSISFQPIFAWRKAAAMTFFGNDPSCFFLVNRSSDEAKIMFPSIKSTALLS